MAEDPLPRVDLHVHIHSDQKASVSLTPAQAAAISHKLNVRFGVLAEGGCKGEIHDDATLKAFLAEMDGIPMWRGLQVYGFEWRKCLSAENLGKLDYIAADALIFPDRSGRNISLWLPGVKFEDAGEFMRRYVEFTERVLSQNIQVWANPTFLPESLQSRYAELWTADYMDRVIQAAVKNHVAIEINARYKIPSAAFIKRAKAAGTKFSFGSNQHVEGIGEIDYCLQIARECGLRAGEIFVPERKP